MNTAKNACFGLCLDPMYALMHYVIYCEGEMSYTECILLNRNT